MASPKILDFDATLIGYTASKIALSIMGRIFGFYYVHIFLDLYKIESSWFQFSQVLYMIWNTVNDPLFAYVQDNVDLPFVKTRRHSLLYGGPVFAVVFLIPWFPWETMGLGTWKTGVHLIVALCLYDTMMTFLGLAQCCLFAEISQKHEDRVRLLRWSKLGPIAGAVVLYFTEYFSSSLKNYFNFQLSCIIWAVLSFLLYWYAGKHCVTQYDVDQTNAPVQSETSRSHLSIWRLTWQILSGRNFLCFVAVNFCHEFHRTFQGNFMAIFVENLTTEEDISLGVRSFCYGFGGLVPSIVIILGAPVIKQLGYYSLVRLSFFVKIGFGISLFLVGPGRPWFLMAVLVLDSGISSAAFALFDMSLSDIAQEDMNKYSRRLPITSMVFGTNALVVKPVYSIAPMVTVAILDSFGYSKMRKDPESLSLEDKSQLHYVMFIMICFVPVLIGLVQFSAWSFYTLKNAYKSRPNST